MWGLILCCLCFFHLKSEKNQQEQKVTRHALILKSRHPFLLHSLPPGHWCRIARPWGHRGSHTPFHWGGRRCSGRSYRGVLLVWADWQRCCCRWCFFDPMSCPTGRDGTGGQWAAARGWRNASFRYGQAIVVCLLTRYSFMYWIWTLIVTFLQDFLWLTELWNMINFWIYLQCHWGFFKKAVTLIICFRV